MATRFGGNKPESCKYIGHLLFWGGPNIVHHVAIYSGNGNMIEAPQCGLSVREVPIRTGGDFLDATRLNSPDVYVVVSPQE